MLSVSLHYQKIYSSLLACFLRDFLPFEESLETRALFGTELVASLLLRRILVCWFSSSSENPAGAASLYIPYYSQSVNSTFTGSHKYDRGLGFGVWGLGFGVW